MKRFVRAFWIFFASAAGFWGQNCYVTAGNTGNCPTSGAQSPDIKTYLGELVTQFQTMRDQASSRPQPKITTSAQDIPASENWILADGAGCFGPPNTCTFATAVPNSVSMGLNAYFDATFFDSFTSAPLVDCVDWNLTPLPYTQAAEYTGSATPANPAYQAHLLAVMDAHAQHIAASGLCLRLAPAPLSNVYTACGLTPASMTVAQMASCLDPMYQAIINHMANLGTPVTITDFTGGHEPTDFWLQSTGQTFSATDWDTFIEDYSAAIKAATGGSSINVGAGFTAGEGSYVTSAAANVPTAAIGFVGVDAYGSVNVPGYASLMSSYAGFCSTAIGAGWKCKGNESDPPRHCPSGGGSCGDDVAYEGCDWINWQIYGLNDVWGALVTKWGAANGFSNWSWFSQQPFGGFTLVGSSAASCNANDPVTSATAAIMRSVANTTVAGLGYGKAGLWPSLSFQGQVPVTGALKVQ